MKDIEKNDVDISKLFEFKADIELKAIDGSIVPAYLRLPNDGDVGRARVKAIRDSSILRANLKDPKWEDREVYLPDVSGLTKEDLVNLIKSYSLRQISVEVAQDIEIPHPKEPEASSELEEHEEYQKAIDEYPSLVNAKILEDITSKLSSLSKILEKKTKNQLISLHEKELIKELSDGKFAISFRQRSAYYSTYVDETMTERFFSSYDEFDIAPNLLKTQIMNEFSRLELSSEALKKSLGVTL